MKVIYNNIIPFPGYIAINLFGTMFVRKDLAHKFNEKSINHESIHTAQMKELGYVGFYLLYFLEWLVRLVIHPKTAYMGISFEKEAYAHEKDLDYLKTRKKFAQWRKN